MKHPISPDTSGLYEKIWNFVREQLSVRYPFFRCLLWNFPFRNPQKHPLPAQMAMSSISAGFSYKKRFRMIPILWKSFFAYAVSLSFPSSDPGDTF